MPGHYDRGPAAAGGAGAGPPARAATEMGGGKPPWGRRKHSGTVSVETAPDVRFCVVAGQDLNLRPLGYERASPVRRRPARSVSVRVTRPFLTLASGLVRGGLSSFV